MSRKVRVCTISMNSLLDAGRFSKEERLLEAEAKLLEGSWDEPDLFLLPEAFLLSGVSANLDNPESYEEEGNEAFRRLEGAARAYNAYIVAPMLIRRADRKANATVVFDRRGETVFTYDKAYPTDGELEKGISAGTRTPPCFQADFGRVGIATCYDLNFQPLFKHYYDQGVELLLFSSYFPGGLLLQTWAHLYGFHAVSSHAQGYESVFVNNLGFVTARANWSAQVLTRDIELDSVAIPHFINREALRLAKEKYGRSLEMEIHRAEGRAILRYLGDKTTVREILREFRMYTREELYGREFLT